MIGHFCTSFQHLYKSAENSPRKVILIHRGTEPFIGEAIAADRKVYLFNHLTSTVNCETMYEIAKKLKISNSYSHLTIFDKRILFTHGVDFPIIILPENFDAEYELFIKNNNKIFRQVTEKFCTSKDNPYTIYAYVLSNGSINFFQWIIKNVFNGVNFSLLYNIMRWNEKYSQIANKLSKGTITAYSGLNSIFGLLKELTNIRVSKRANDSLVQFNTTQKHLIREKIEDKNVQNILNKFGRLSETKKNNFIRKMSTIDDCDEILKQMSALCDIHFSWSRESLLDYINTSNSLKCEVIYDKDNFMILSVKDYETIKRLAKTTNWCISKNKRYWNDYIEHRHDSVQYVIFDFNLKEDDELSIVGFTVGKKQGITHAHSFTNQNLMGGESSNCNNLVSFIPMRRGMNINSILNEHNVPFDIFFKTSKLPFEWNKESFLNYLYSIVQKNNTFIVHDEGNKLALSCKDAQIYKMFSHDLLNNFDCYYFEYEMFFFLDFNLDVTSFNKILFSFILKNGNDMEYGTNLYNMSLRETNMNFDEKIEEYGIPYDVIRRNNSIINRFTSALASYNLNLVEMFISDEKYRNEICKNIRSLRDYSYVINDSLFGHYSTSVIEVFYNNHCSLSSVFGIDHTKSLISSLGTEIANRFEICKNIPNDELMNKFKERSIINQDLCVFLGFFDAFKMMVENEPNDAFNGLARNMSCLRYNEKLFNFLFDVVSSKINIDDNYSALSRIISQSVNYNNKYVLTRIGEITKKNDIKKLISEKLNSKKETSSWHFSSTYSS